MLVSNKKHEYQSVSSAKLKSTKKIFATNT